MRTGLFRAGAIVASLTLTFGALMSACADENVNPAKGGDGGDGVGGDGEGGAAEGGMGGSEAPYVPSRGNPNDFPTTCMPDCQTACDRLDMCGGAESELFPVERDACLTRCGLQLGGPIWDDISGNFTCCTAQDSCQQVQHCGGWIDHPAPRDSCDRICSCFFNSTIAALGQGKHAPYGYQFAAESVYIELDDPATAPRTIDHAQLTTLGQYAHVRVSDEADAATLDTLRALGTVLPTFRDRDGRIAAATGTIVAELPTQASKAFALDVASRHQLKKPFRKLSFGPQMHVIELDAWAALDAVRELQEAGIAAELDLLRRYAKRYVPDDPLFEDQWHLLNTGQDRSLVGVDVRASEAWDITLGDAQVIIAINDDGVDLNHADFAGKLEPALNYPGNWEGLLATGQFGGHGTPVAGVAAARGDDSYGATGACPDCRILPHRLGESDFNGFQLTATQIAEGFTAQVDAGAWIINNSWGYPTGQPTFVEPALPTPAMPSVVQASLEYAETNGRGGLGTVVLFAAGNDNDVLDAYAKHPTTVAVAAIGDNGMKSYYSSFGAEITIGAPSNGAIAGITTPAAGGDHTSSFGGTSSASPLAAGVFGLVFSANPSLTAAEARDIVAQSSTEIDTVFGNYQDGHSEFYGAGMVNAYVAVQMATGCTDPALCPAPSDDCGQNCGSATMCSNCRTTADCAVDHVCQALPSVGALVCVPTDAGGCGSGTTPVNGYCLPDAATCGFCPGVEECDGQDDDCDGEVDEDSACTGGARCFADGPGCPVGEVCAGASCTNQCFGDDDCSEGSKCRPVKDQFGASNASVMGCVTDTAGFCQIGCSVLVSSTTDDTITMFNECMMNGEVACGSAQACALLLPISF